MPYALVEEGATYADWQEACRAINEISLTEAAFIAGRAARRDPAAFSAFAAQFGGVPEATVRHAIGARDMMLVEADMDGFDLEHEQPELFRSIVTDPLSPADFMVFADDEH